MANLDLFESKDLRPCAGERGQVQATLERLGDLPIVGDVRGAGYFYGIELVRTRPPRKPSTDGPSAPAARVPVKALGRRRACTAAPTIAATVISFGTAADHQAEEFDGSEESCVSVLTEAWSSSDLGLHWGE